MIEYIDLLCWIGNIIFALSGIPQAVKCYQQGHGKGLSQALLWMWVVGEIIALFYAYMKDLPVPLLLNYSINLICLLVILRYKYVPRRD